MKTRHTPADRAAARLATAERRLAKAEAKLTKAEAKLEARKKQLEEARAACQTAVAEMQELNASPPTEAMAETPLSETAPPFTDTTRE
jgi:chromosome segregation ATPase